MNFEFDGMTSHTYDLAISYIGDKGISYINVLPDIEIEKDMSGRGPIPFYYGVKMTDVLEFPMEVYNKNGSNYNYHEILEIQEWLFNRKKPCFLSIYDSEMGDVNYECWLKNPQYGKLSNGAIGWKFNVVCTSPYAVTDYVVKVFDCTETQNTIIEYFNLSSMEDYLYPEMSITMYGNENFLRIENMSDNNRVFQLNDLAEEEKIYVNNRLGYLTAQSGDKLFSKFNYNFFRFTEGYNKIRITGRCNIIFKTRFYKTIGGY
ncbi:MAG TPA: hypothetical protein DCM73_08325 [Clostridiales bacterium]|nr:hypothetical protein [Clostridiales bacterium]